MFMSSNVRQFRRRNKHEPQTRLRVGDGAALISHLDSVPWRHSRICGVVSTQNTSLLQRERESWALSSSVPASLPYCCLPRCRQQHTTVGICSIGERSITIQGVVAQFEWANPHVYLHVEIQSDSGEPVVWALELGFHNRNEKTWLVRRPAHAR